MKLSSRLSPQSKKAVLRNEGVVSVHMEVSPNCDADTLKREIESLGGTLTTGTFFLCTVDAAKLPQIADLPGVIFVEVAQRLVL